ncbi:beta-hexosaminidase, partial [human gut metagenome]
TRIEKFLNSKGRRIIGWDEILEGDVAPNATVMSWRGSAGGIKAAQLGHDVIMTPNDYCYFDYYQSEDTRHEPFAIGGFVPLEKVYSLNPTASLTEEQAKHILGAQANLWTEYIPTSEQVEYMVLPRMAALAEVQWTQQERKIIQTSLPDWPDSSASTGETGSTTGNPSDSRQTPQRPRRSNQNWK